MCDTTNDMLSGFCNSVPCSECLGEWHKDEPEQSVNANVNGKYSISLFETLNACNKHATQPEGSSVARKDGGMWMQHPKVHLAGLAISVAKYSWTVMTLPLIMSDYELAIKLKIECLLLKKKLAKIKAEF